MNKVLIVFLVLALLFLAYIAYEIHEHKNIEFKHISVGFGTGLKAVLISDLHCNSISDKTFLRLSEVHPDMIFIAGDLINKKTKYLEREQSIKYLEQLSKIAPVFYALGNHEMKYRKTNPEGWKDFLNMLPTEVFVLDNEHMCFDENLEIYGLTLPEKYFKKGRAILPTFEEFRAEADSFTGNPKGKFKVLLAHNPDYIDYYNKILRPDLTLSGHLHGGLIRLPSFGGIVFSTFGISHRSDGFFEREHLYVSRGLGDHFIPIRFNNLCEITILRL